MLWRPPTNTRQRPDGNPQMLIPAVPLVNGRKLLMAGCTHSVGTESRPLLRAGEKRLVGISQSLCQQVHSWAENTCLQVSLEWIPEPRAGTLLGHSCGQVPIVPT